jgi:hypothetical protein
LAKKLNPDATIATLPDEPEGEVYYDAKLKRWIFPDTDLAEAAKPLAPPPTTPIIKSDSTPVSTPKPVSNDPLAAMMAPPSRSRLTTPNSGLRGPPMIPRSHNNMSKNTPPMSSNTAASPAATAPPQFVIFKPKSEDEK